MRLFSALLVLLVLGSTLIESAPTLGTPDTPGHAVYSDVPPHDLGGHDHSDVYHDSHFGHSSVQLPSACCVVHGVSSIVFLTSFDPPDLIPQEYIFSRTRPPSV